MGDQMSVATGQDLTVTRQIGAIRFVPVSAGEAADAVVMSSLRVRSEGAHVHLANAYSIALADKDPATREAFSGDAINFADGKPLTWFSKIRGHRPAVRQVRGPQLFRDVFDRGREHGLKHYLLGSTNETLLKLKFELEDQFPGVEIVGMASPPFRTLSPAEVDAQDSEIKESGAHVVWVGLGTPKQDFEVARLANSLPVVAVAVGAAFDFVAKTVAEAPSWIGAIGFEWLYRFASEPRRLWRRYLFGNVRFVWSLQKNWSKR